MPEIKQTQLSTAPVTVPATTIAGVVSLAYRRGIGQVLVIENKSASAISPRITGRQASELTVEGLGQVDLSGGLQLETIAAGASIAIKLDNVRRWLTGQVEVSGAAGAVAYVATIDAVPTYALWMQGGRLVANGRLVMNTRLG